MCYCIYLFPFIIIYGVKHFSASLHFGENFWLYVALQCCLFVPVVLLFCGAFFLLIELPCMDREWPMKLWRQAQTLAVCGTAATILKRDARETATTFEKSR